MYRLRLRRANSLFLLAHSSETFLGGPRDLQIRQCVNTQTRPACAREQGTGATQQAARNDKASVAQRWRSLTDVKAERRAPAVFTLGTSDDQDANSNVAIGENGRQTLDPGAQIELEAAH